jgi:hypothetical protein
MTRLKTVAVENPGDDVVPGDQRQGAHSLDDIGRRAVALSPPTARQPVLGMVPAYPVNGQHDLGRGVIEIGHGFVDDRAHNPLLQPGIGRRC